MNIIITGTSRGIGLELAKKFTKTKKWKVLALSRNMSPLEVLDPYENFRKLPFDLGNPGEMSQLLALVESFFDGKTDILINNAGVLINKPFENLLETDFDEIFDVNVKGAFLLIRQLLPFFSKHSHIINIGSMGGYQGSAKFPGLSLYSASKGALAILSECLAEELKPRKIAVNTLALAAVNTEMLQSAFPGYKAQLSASQMADYIMEFAINGHQFYNGKILPVSQSTP